MSAKDHQFTSGSRRSSRSSIPRRANCARTSQQILEEGKITLKENVKAEMHQSVVELGTDICDTAGDAARAGHPAAQRTGAAAPARRGLKIASAGTHPFSHWNDQRITEGERYETIVKDLQQVARANLIFGLHVHVGIPDRVRRAST